jgi:hypothetical protein
VCDTLQPRKRTENVVISGANLLPFEQIGSPAPVDPALAMRDPRLGTFGIAAVVLLGLAGLAWRLSTPARSRPPGRRPGHPQEARPA